MTPPWYPEWVRHHCETTGAPAAAADALLLAEFVLLGDWQAEEIELWECTRRLVAGMRVPKFASDHGDAIGIELRTMRAARRQAEAEAAATARAPSRCEWCHGSGSVLVPNAHCVHRGGGRAVGHPRLGYFATVVVWCDCEAGRFAAGRAQPYPAGPMTLATYESGYVRRGWWRRAMAEHGEARGVRDPGRELDPHDPFDAILIRARQRQAQPAPKPRFLLAKPSNRAGAL